ncbi:MAG: tetratricopeptide repeat protein [Terriglobia bacterium]
MAKRINLVLAVITLAVFGMVVGLGYVVVTGVLNKPAPRTAVEKEIVFWEDSVRRQANNAEAHYSLGLAYLAGGETSKAKDEFEIALKLDKKYYQANLGLALVLKEQKKFPAAIKELKKVIERVPTHIEANYQLGIIYQDQKEYDKAVKVFKDVLEINPQNADVHFILGFTYEEEGKKSKAKKQYKEALRFVPGHELATEGLKRLKED